MAEERWKAFLSYLCCSKRRGAREESDESNIEEKETDCGPLLQKVSAGGGNSSKIVELIVSKDPSIQRMRETFDRLVGSESFGSGACDDQPECVMCLEIFSKEDPAMLTLCQCGMNRSLFHYRCLLSYMDSGHSTCPSCRGQLYFEEHSLE